MTYSSAGHPPPILVTPEGEPAFLDQAQSLPLAVNSVPSQRPQSSVTLSPGATLMLYTDGLVERRHQPLDDGLRAAADALASGAMKHPDEIADELITGMMPAAGFEDDVAVLIYRHPAAPLTVQVSTDEPACLAAIRSRLRQWLAATGVSREDGADILVAVGEPAANAIEHAPAGRPDGQEPVQITVTARVANAAAEVTVADNGTWRPAHEQPDTRGNGIPVMRALTDEVTILRFEDGTVVTMTKEL
jgi:anti-sigma regulatory factor (Ser/Thr protein kinase)